jgi:outer membrane protein assembly factor BamB
MRRISGCVGWGALVLLLAGCWWPAPGQGPDRQAHNDAETQITPGTVADLEPLWVAQTADGSVGDPVTSIRGVHVNDRSSVYAFHPDTGQQLWTVHQPGGGLTMEQPYVHGEELWVSSLDGSNPTGVGPAVALDAETGAVVANLANDGAVAGLRGDLAAFWGNVVINGVTIAVMDVFDTVSSTWICCDDLWIGAAGPKPRWPVTLGGNMLFDAGDGLTHTDYDNLGNGVRGFQISPPRPCSWFPSGMCPLWATPLDGTDSTAPVLSTDQTTVYVGTDAGTIYAVDAATGAIMWSAPVGSAMTDSPALANGSLFVPTEAGGLVVLDATGCGAATCTPTWVATTGGTIMQQPAVAGGVVFAGTDEGTVSAFDAAGCGAPTCTALWSASTSSEITGAPAISNSQLYVGTADGRLLAYGLA